jgi:DNA-directed RNA polymerase subunit M/transcription elongation factor TFIIS
MPLPTLSTPKYQLTIPSTKEKISYRPFLVKEEKVLLSALESSDGAAMLNSMSDVVMTCTDGKVVAEKYPLFDIEYIFLNLRMKSVGEVCELILPCKNTECGEKVTVNLDLEDVKIDVPDEKSRVIEIDKSLGLTLRYPTIKEAEKYEDVRESADTIVGMIVDCIESVYDENEIYPAKDHTREELEKFVESIPSAAFQKIVEFFENIPTLKHTIEFKCPKCKKKSVYELEGLSDFFEYASSTTLSIVR